MATTLNHIKRKLTGYFETHAQINTAKYMDSFDFAAEADLVYPVAHLQYVTTGTNGKETIHAFEITLADLSDDNVKGIEDEIYSDLLEIADDFAAWLWDQNEFVFDRRMNIQKFVEANGDRIAGITFVVRLGVIGRGNPCQTPTKS